MTNFLIFFVFNLIFFMNYLLIAKKYSIFDYPDNIRKKHKNPTPLLGGLLIYLNVILYTILHFFFDGNENFFYSNNDIIIFFIGSTFFYYLGYFDDKYHVRANYKLFLTSLIIVLLMYFDENLIISNINFTFSN